MQHASSPVAPRAPCDTTVHVICPVTVPVPMCTRAHMCAPDPPYRPLCLHAPTYARAHARTHPTTHPQCTDLRQDSHWQHDGAQGGPVGHGSGKAVLRRVPCAAACLALAVRPGALGFVSRAWWWLGLRHCRHTSGPSICRCLLWHVCVCVQCVCACMVRAACVLHGCGHGMRCGSSDGQGPDRGRGQRPVSHGIACTSARVPCMPPAGHCPAAVGALPASRPVQVAPGCLG